MVVGEEFILDGIKLVNMDAEPQEITNPYSGQSCMLEPKAISLYDYIKGCETLGESEWLSQGLEVFLNHWPKEYMILLD